MYSHCNVGRWPDMAPAFPVRSREFHAEVGGAEATFILSAYADRVMVVVTQLGTLGTVQLARWACRALVCCSAGMHVQY